MRYVGGKHRISSWVSSYLIPRIKNCNQYLEPFVGSGAIFEKMQPLFFNTTVSDSHEDLILMWQAIANGWDPPESVTKEEYIKLRSASPSALRGFVGYGASFGGKWFGGYVNTAWDSYHDRYTLPYLAAAKRSVLKLANNFAKAKILCCDYREYNPQPRTFVYCDPPYEGVLGYQKSFDNKLFWEVMEKWSKQGAIVIVSESKAPSQWTTISTKVRKHMLQVATKGENDLRSESLYQLL